jgi:hypothetical protein
MVPDVLDYSKEGLFAVTLPVRGRNFELSPFLPVDKSVQIVENFLDVLDSGVPGDVAEFGIAGGDTLKWMVKYLKEKELGKHAWGFDWFQGLPAFTEGDLEYPQTMLENPLEHSMMGWYKGTREQVTANLFAETGYYSLVDGRVEETSKSFHHPICFANLNMDMYAGTYAALELLYRVMPKDGRATVLSYGTHWHGVTKAVDQVLLERPDAWEMEGEHWIVTLKRL